MFEKSDPDQLCHTIRPHLKNLEELGMNIDKKINNKNKKPPARIKFRGEKDD